MTEIDEKIRHLEAEIKRLNSKPKLYKPADLNEISRPGTIYTPADGWIPVSSTWSYASATTITVPSGAASIYSVGDKIKLNNTDLKYFYIVGVADTLLTVTGGSDYTLDSDAISAVYYSKAATPLGFTDVFSYTVTPTYAGGNTDPTGWTAIVGTYAISGKKATLWVFGQLNRGTGNRTYIKFNLPVVYSTATSAVCTHTLLSSTFTTGVVYMTGSGLTLSLGAAMANNGYVWISATYRI